MPTQAKIDAVAEIKADYESSEAVVLTEYRGLSVPQLKELRRSLGSDTKYSVVKNTLAAIALKESGADVFDGQLVGPTAMAFIKGDPVQAAKGLTDFAKDNPELVLKSGVFEGKPLSESDMKSLADLESRETQLSRVAGVLQAIMGKTVRTVDALRQKLEEEGGVSSDGTDNSVEVTDEVMAETPDDASDSVESPGATSTDETNTEE